jgi:hypothetical protein
MTPAESSKDPMTTKIGGYDVVYSSNANGNVPRIMLKSGDDEFIGQLTFQHNASTLSADDLTNGHVYLYYHLEDFENILSLLGNVHNKPVYLQYNNGNAKFENGISTSF